MTMTDDRQQLEIPIDTPPADDLLDQIRALIGPALTRGDLDQRVDTINAIREIVAEYSPFATEPVDMIRWVPADSVQANDYNPNAVAPPEMELLRLSIMADGYTQPIVTNAEGDARIVIDGFHRNRVGKECADVRDRVHGYLPVVQIRADRDDRGDRIASTIRHNRARGKHQVVAMSDIVVELKRRNWSDNRIAKELGMDPDEVLRLTQITGLAVAFGDRDFSSAWQHVGLPDDQATEDDESTPIDLEWMRNAPTDLKPKGWDDRTENSSVLYDADGKQLGAIQRSRFKEDEWFWYAYSQPMREDRAPSREAAKASIETHMGVGPHA